MIPVLDLKAVNARYRDALIAACTAVIDSGWYITGSALTEFEAQFAAYCGSDHCIGVGNGLDALALVLQAWKALGRLRDGDEVIVPANTFIASVLAITQSGLRPVLIDPDPDHFGLSAAQLQPHLTKVNVSDAFDRFKPKPVAKVNTFPILISIAVVLEVVRPHAKV